MFEMLDERIKQDEAVETTKRERLLKWVAGGGDSRRILCLDS